MRLLKSEKTGPSPHAYTFSLIRCDTRNLPKYAILSHRWGSDQDEVTFEDLENGTAKDKARGYDKLKFCADRVAQDGLVYFWVDTCCINKANNTELSEAINSMFRWYQNAVKCYVYLPHISAEQEWEEEFQRSEWFGRGWTLQELIAPRVVEFFSKEGTRLGDKQSLMGQIQQATGISTEALQGKPLSEISEQERFSWTARRQTTVDEDALYCLLGIFGVYMPLIYGEGRQNALIRLQREIRLRGNPDLYAIKEAAWVVPFERNPLFTGRESQLAELEGKLVLTTGTRKIAVIGLGGVGKTQLVLELLYRYKEQHKGCSIIWIAATGMKSIEQGYLTVAQQLNIAGYNDPKADVKRLVQDHLSQDEVDPWLLVYDNADDIDLWTATLTPGGHVSGGEQSQMSRGGPRRLIDYLPRCRRGCIIFTTRNRKVAVTLAPTNLVTVPAMSEAAATQLLTASLDGASRLESSQNASQLLAALTYLPLAITQAAAYISTNDITLSEYLSLLDEKEEEVIDLLSEDFEDYGRYQDIKNPIATTWLISFEQIRRSDPLAADYLSFMSCVHPRDIPQALLPPGPSRKREIDALGTLTAYSFVSRRPTSTALDLHRLVHLTTRNWLRQEGSLYQWTEKTFSRLKAVLPKQGYEHEERFLWRSYLPHAQQVLTSDIVDDDNEQRIELMWKYGRCLNSDGRWDEVEAVFSEILVIQIRTLGENSDSVLTPKSWLASTYRNQGRWKEAEQLDVQVMETSKTKLRADHPDTLISIANLASTYRKQGRWEEAKQLDVQVMEVRKMKLGADHPDTLTSMANLASTYWNQGRWKEAEQLQVQVMETSKTKLGADHPDTLTSIANLASTYWNQGRWEEAEQLQVQVMETRKTKLGADHPDTLTSIANLASTYWNQGRWKEAEQLDVQVMETRKTKLGADHPHTLTSIANLASTYWNQGRWKEAEQLQVQVIETSKTKLGADHPHTLISMANLACTYKDIGRDEEAIQLLRDCFERQTDILGVSHPDTVSSCKALAEWEAEEASSDSGVSVDEINS